MPPQPPRPRRPQPPLLKSSTIYKTLLVIAVVLIAFWLWRVYTHLPPAQPLQYPPFHGIHKSSATSKLNST
jgi:hypothetical protein